MAVEDANGNVFTTSTDTITVSLAPGSGGTLSGTTSVAAVNAVATFAGLSVTPAGKGYQLVAPTRRPARRSPASPSTS
ncbi:MAG: hypothetical protein ACYDEN_01455 [Acidimicrobiales bacterium]